MFGFFLHFLASSEVSSAGRGELRERDASAGRGQADGFVQVEGRTTGAGPGFEFGEFGESRKTRPPEAQVSGEKIRSFGTVDTRSELRISYCIKRWQTAGRRVFHPEPGANAPSP